MAPVSHSPARSAPGELVAYIDGGSRGNPGPAGYGAVIQDAAGRTVETLSEFLGETTNNVAEYRALLAALEYATGHNTHRLKVYCDSELVARQMQGRYRVQSPDLKPLHQRAQELVRQLSRFSIEHIPRAQNFLADRLANEAMNRGESSLPLVESFTATVAGGKLQPLPPLPHLEEGAEYEVRARKRNRPNQEAAGEEP